MRRQAVIPLILIGLIGAITLLVVETKQLSVSRINIRLDDLPESFSGFTIVHLSDLHAATFGRKQESIAGILRNQKIDAIVFTGDLIDPKIKNFEAAKEFLRLLVGTAPTYVVLGNRDAIRVAEVRRLIRDVGAIELFNTATPLVRANNKVWLVGVGDPYIEWDNLEGSISKINTSKEIEILLVHSPDVPLVRRASRSSIDLILTGHTHGGQIRLPLLGALIIPGQPTPPVYVAGLYVIGKTQMYVNRGLGTSTLPVRFLSKPEVAFITLFTQ